MIDTVRVDRGLLRGGRDVFGLRVAGDSMIEAGILNGDYIFVRKQATADRGDVVVALIGDEATVKYYYPERDYIRFQPANSRMAPILGPVHEFQIDDASWKSRRHLSATVIFFLVFRLPPRNARQIGGRSCTCLRTVGRQGPSGFRRRLSSFGRAPGMSIYAFRHRLPG